MRHSLLEDETLSEVLDQMDFTQLYETLSLDNPWKIDTYTEPIFNKFNHQLTRLNPNNEITCYCDWSMTGQ